MNDTTKEQQCDHRYGSKDDPLICGECGQHVATPSGRVEIVEFLNKRTSTVAVTDDMATKEEQYQQLHKAFLELQYAFISYLKQEGEIRIRPQIEPPQRPDGYESYIDPVTLDTVFRFKKGN